MLEGGCFCNNVRYEIADQAYLSVDCHCSMCRHVHAAPYVTWVVVPRDRHRYTGAEPSRLESSDHGTRFFCPRCGTHVACITADHPDNIDVPLGSLDEPTRFAPSEEIFCDTRLPWLAPLADGAPR